ncbi:MAG: hypothetical protein ACW990_05585 [Promethearchaeota archaeon]|jgi:hypothetical protein
MESDGSGEIIETPEASEVYERLPEPERGNVLNEEVKIWQARINVARKIREKKLKDLTKHIEFYEGIQWHIDDEVTSLKDRSTINLIFANIKKELPYLYFQNPTAVVNAQRPEFELNAFAMKELLNAYAKNDNKTELKKHVRLAILDAKFSFGCLKVSYTPRFMDNSYYGKPKVTGYDEFGFPIFLRNEQGNILLDNRDKIITKDLYYVERVSPRELLIDPECRNSPELASWIGHEVVKPLGYLKDNDLYTNTEKLNKNVDIADVFKSTLFKTNEEVSAVKELYGNEDTEKVKFVEIYDLKRKKLLVLPDNHNSFIRNSAIRLNPFSFLKFNEKPDEFYPISDVSQEVPLQQEINVGNSMMITHARRSARKYYYTEETFRGIDDVEGLEAMKDPDDLTLVKIAEYDKPPAPVQMAVQDPSVYQNLFQSKINFNEVSGSTEMERGLTERRKTKGEAQFQEGHSSIRRGDKQSLVADFITDTYEKLAKLMQATLSVPQAIKIIGPTGMFWTEVKGGDIQGELSYDIEVSDLRPQIPELDRVELGEFIFALSNILNSILANPIGPMVFNIQGLVKEFSKSYPAINVENILNMKVTPEQIAEVLIMQLEQKNKTGAENQDAAV